jgi:hypothetical protein
MLTARLSRAPGRFLQRSFSGSRRERRGPHPHAPPAKSNAQVFIDLNWMDKQLCLVASKRFGDDFASACAFDAAPLLPFLEQRVGEALSLPSLTVSAAYGYGSLRRDRSVRIVAAVDSVRAFAEEGIAIRNYSTSSDSTPCAPAVSLTADLVHACAIRGNVDTGTPLFVPRPSDSSSSSPNAPFDVLPTQVVVALIGSPVYFPGLVRAMQHDRTVVVGSNRSEWGRLVQVWNICAAGGGGGAWGAGTPWFWLHCSPSLRLL